MSDLQPTEQLQYLAEKECRVYQGYSFSKLIPVEQFTNLLRSGKAAKLTIISGLQRTKRVPPRITDTKPIRRKTIIRRLCSFLTIFLAPALFILPGQEEYCAAGQTVRLAHEGRFTGSEPLYQLLSSPFR